MSQYIGSSGTLIATVLEGIGYAYQSFVLDTMSSVLLGPVAVLLFIGATLVIVARYLFTGKGLGQIVWFLAGSALLSSILLSRTPTSGPLWKFGRSERNQAQVTYEQQKMFERKGVGLAPGAPLPQVSSLFATFNGVVSSMTSAITQVLIGARGHIDGRFLFRTQLAASVRASEIADARLQALVQQMLLRGCGNMIETAKNVPKIAQRVSRGPMTAFEQSLNQRVSITLALAEGERVHLEDRSPLIRELFTELNGTHPALFAQALSLEPDDFGTVLASAPFVEKPVKAEDIRFSDPEGLPENLTCRQVWNITHLALLHHASQENQKYQEISKGLIGNENALLNDLTLIRRPSGELDADELMSRRAQMVRLFTRVLASYFLRNELSRPSPGSFIQEYSKRGFSFPTLSAPGESDLSAVERARNEYNSFVEKRGIFTTLSSLPYYQGILLYLLSLLFPFFALLLLIPTRVKAFMLWFFLWIWAKSWDIGFAAVMLLDDFLFKLLSEQHTNPEELFKIGLDGADFASIMWSIQQLDPSFNLGTYYSLLAVALGAVPVASSLLIMGALRGGANLVANAAGELTNTLKGATDAALTQKVGDRMRLAGSVAEIKRARKLFAATNGNYGIDYNSDQWVNPNGMRYSYQSGSPQNRGAGEMLEDFTNSSIESGRLGGLLQKKEVGDELASQGSAGGLANPITGFQNYMKQALNFETPIAGVMKAVIDQRAQYLSAVATANFTKRMALAGNEAYRTSEVNEAVGPAMAARTIVFPMTPKDGDEKAHLEAELTMQFEGELRGIAESVAKASNLPISMSDWNSPIRVQQQIELQRSNFQRLSEERSAVPWKRTSSRYDDLIRETSARYGVDEKLIFAMISQESAFSPSARSPAGALGLMQLMPKTAESLGVKDPFDPAQNIEGGVKHMKRLLEKYQREVEKETGNGPKKDPIALALAAYNAGEGRVEQYNNTIPPIQETQEYVRNVRQRYDSLKAQDGK